MIRSRQRTAIGGVFFLLLCTFYILHSSYTPPSYTSSRPKPPTGQGGGRSSFDDYIPADPKPKPLPRGSHPIWHLVKDGEKELQVLQARQSKTLPEAVAEYRRRYKIPPPPNFDKWFAFAQARDVQLIDEFDTIFELLTPFWGLKPKTIRDRAKEALGYEKNQLMGVQIRRGKVTNMQGAKDWQQNATQGMMKDFIQWLPDMDLAFNIHDEPRVIVPHDDMERLVARATRVNMPAAMAVAEPRNAWGKNTGSNEGARFDETKLTRFNVFAHQRTWTHSRMSCPPDSPSRALEEAERVDELGKYALGELGFVYNASAMSDICLTPSLAETYGFFDRPNAFNIVHDLFPIFSQSKISSYSDILYPSPWYWFEKVPYDEEKDMQWEQKLDRLYWRGSTTGGFSRDGAWRRQHRQRLVSKINAVDQAKVLVNRGSETDPEWAVKEVARTDFKDLMDVYFSHVGQCDDGDCEAQREFFDIKDMVDQQDAWKYKYLLDMDGNAFSGRFYAFLRSRSLVYKFAIFREWHLEWLKPWVHYIPLSTHGDEWLEAVRFFGDGSLGKREAQRLAMQGRDWANKVLRNEDLEVWFFRLLLEYGRVIDDDREIIGFAA